MSSYSVYTGIWRNWNENSGHGALVLTVDPTGGRYLIAFIALFVGTAMSHLWTIACFIMHQFRATNAPRSGFYHQTEALLRNSQSSGSMLWTLVKMTWRWRSKGVGAVRGSLLLMMSAALHLALLTAATVLSSRVLSTGDEVQVHGDMCGWIVLNGTQNNTALQQDVAFASDMAAKWTAAQVMKYVGACYNTTSFADSATCKFYTRTSLSSTSSSEIPCPFSSRICATQNAFQVDTGLIDSQHDLGINTPADSAIKFRKILTCAPILAERFSSGNWSTTAPPGVDNVFGDLYWYYYLGPMKNRNYTWVADVFSFEAWASQAYTLQYSFDISNAIGHGSSACSPDDGLTFYIRCASVLQDNFNASYFQPIPELRVNNSDLTILFLTNRAQYPREVHDPWYKATSLIPSGNDSGEADSSWFVSDRALSALACTEQYQFCNSWDACTDPKGLYTYLDDALRPSVPELNLNDAQEAALSLIWSAASGVRIYQGVGFLGDQLLLAQNYLASAIGTASAPLPPTQWQDEVRNMANLMLAALQREVVDFASPPDVPVSTTLRGTVSSREYVTLGGEGLGSASALCTRIRIRDSAYYNFSVAGLCVVLAVGLAIMLVNTLCVPDAVFWIRRALGLGEYPQQAWLEGHWLRLLSTAFEKHSGIVWDVEKHGEIPVTVRNGHLFRGMGLWRSPRKTRKESHALDSEQSQASSMTFG